MFGARDVAVVACVAVLAAACSSGADEDDTGGLPRFRAAPSASAPSESVSEAVGSEPSDVARIVEAYWAYTEAVSQALAAGDEDLPALRGSAAGQALKDARQRVRANRSDGVVTSGRLEPSVTTAQVAWSGGDQAAVSDCVLNGLGHVDADRPDVVVAEADGTRRPVEAQVVRNSDGWVVSRVEMPQDDDSDNRQTDRPFLRGPMPDGPPSCAPPELERELLARYQAFWDAFDRAFGFGRDGPADPDDPALADTQVNPQLSDTRSHFRELRDKNQTSRGERDARDPWVLAVTDFDETAFVADCVTLGDSQTIDLDNDAIVEENSAGQRDYYETRMTARVGVWKVAKLNITAERLEQCESPT